MKIFGLNPLLEILDEPQSDVQICCTCGKCKSVDQFYIESFSKRKYVYQRRKQCVDCWSELKGKKRRPSTGGSKLFYYEAI